MKVKSIVLAVILILGVTACQKNEAPELIGPLDDSPIFRELPTQTNSSALKSASANEFEILKAEYYTSGEGGEIGRTVYFSNNGNKKLGADFIPEASLDGTTNVTYYIDEDRPTADVVVATSSAAISRAMSTWDGVTCSDLGMTNTPYDGRPTGFVAALLGYGGSFAYVADVTHCGWLPGGFFDIVALGGSNYILGVTFTLVFTGTNIVAWREIYYNDNFTWKDGDHYDIETIALHEAGHGLSQAHFGKAFRTSKNGKLHFSPRAVMNAGYSGIQTEILETDLAGHCSIWANWPQN
ncbi:MAG: hypothetical protein ABFS32_22235 [Bacteroidota bacterium]